jgi:Dienelactone hydrolase family
MSWVGTSTPPMPHGAAFRSLPLRGGRAAPRIVKIRPRGLAGGKVMSLQPIVYDCGGAKLPAFSPYPRRTGPCRASLVAHDAPGVNDHVKSRAEALAELGYAAFALDLYGIRGSPREEMVVRHTKLVETPGLFLERATAGLRTLAAQPLVDASRLAAVGFCQGGITVLELARAGAPHSGGDRLSPWLYSVEWRSGRPHRLEGAHDVGHPGPLCVARRLCSFSIEMEAKAADLRGSRRRD